MKALTSSCSNAIFENVGSLSPGVSVRLSNRPQVCFALRSINDKKGYNFGILKLDQNKGICPVHAVPPKDQVDLETAEPQAQQSEQTNESKTVRVAFQLEKNCNFGEQFLIVGNDPMLGSWDPSDALPMTWSDGHVWTVELDIPAGKTIQFKFILKGIGGDISWQPGSDRIIQTWESMNRITVCEDWENAELQKITEEPHVDQVQEITAEDQLAELNKKPRVVSRVTTYTELLDNPQKRAESYVSEISSIEDTQNHEEGKPLTERVLQQVTDNNISPSMEKPMAIIAENIGSSQDPIKSTSSKKKKKNMIQQSEESADGPINDGVILDVDHNGNSAAFKNQERTIVQSSLFDLEGGPVLVPGLMPPTEPTDEAGPDKVQEKTTMETSTEAFEVKDQNQPESNKEQESDDGASQEINATINNEPELLDMEYEERSLLTPSMEEGSNYQPVDDNNTLQNDIKWGNETVKKFLTKLGFL